MSPEQCKSARDVTDKSDVYTLGLMLYEMLCGESPYADVKSEVMLMGAQIGQPAPPLSEKGTEASAELCALVHRMLEKQPEARPSASELAAILKRMTGSQASTIFPVVPAQALASGERSGPVSVGNAAPTATADAATQSEAAAPALRLPQGGRYLIAIAGGTLGLGLIGLILVLRSVLRPPTPPPPPPTVHWHLVSDPKGADVVDESGALIGHTPFDRTQPRSPGQATFTLRHGGYDELKLTLDQSKDVDSNVTLTPTPPPVADEKEEKPTPIKKKANKNKKRAGRGK
jgi:serine/threonine protein kinase